LAAASRLLGVSPNTLRRWGDAERIRVFTTPGGHRRFMRRDVEQFLANPEIAHLSGRLSEVRERILSAIARNRPGGLAAEDPPVARSPALAAVRLQGIGILDVILAYLGSEGAASAESRAELMTRSTEYGRALFDVGLPFREALRGLLEAHNVLMDEIATLSRMRRLSIRATTEFLRKADRAGTDSLLAIVEGYQERQAELAH
jgi:excisionase family DNA binding protein